MKFKIQNLKRKLKEHLKISQQKKSIMILKSELILEETLNQERENAKHFKNQIKKQEEEIFQSDPGEIEDEYIRPNEGYQLI